MEQKAVIDSTAQYRYLLTRRWAPGNEACFVMLNPSTADAFQDDPTIRKCVGFARNGGFGGMRIVNLYAFRATDPKVMKRAKDPIGPNNDSHILEAIDQCNHVIVAWGNNAELYRVQELRVMLKQQKRKAWALKINVNGSPAHPLMLSYSRNLVEWK